MLTAGIPLQAPGPGAPARRRAHLLLLRHRRLIAAVLAAAATLSAIHAVRPSPPATVPALIATRDLGAGFQVGADDVSVSRLPARHAPDGLLVRRQQAVGRILAGGVRAGEALTDVRVLGHAALELAGPGLAVAAVRLADGAVAEFLRPGYRVDVLGSPADPGWAWVGSDVAPAGGSGTSDRETGFVEHPIGSQRQDEPAHPGPEHPAAGDTRRQQAVAPGVSDVVAADVLVLAVKRDAGPGWGPSGGTSTGLVLLAAGPEIARRLAAQSLARELAFVLHPAPEVPLGALH